MADRAEMMQLRDMLVDALALADRIGDHVTAAFLTEMIERMKIRIATGQ